MFGFTVHHHHHGGTEEAQLSRIEQSQRRMELKMSALDDELAGIKATQDTTLATIATCKTGIESLLAKLGTVQASPGLSQDQQKLLDAIRDEGVTIAQNLSNVSTEANPPAPAPTPAPTPSPAPADGTGQPADPAPPPAT